MRALIALLTIFFVTLVIGVMLLNASETVTLRLWWDNPAQVYEDLPLGVVILGAISVGFVFTGIVAMVEGMKIRLENHRLAKRLREVQAELDGLRSQAYDLPDELPAEAAAPAGPAVLASPSADPIGLEDETE